MTATLLEWDDRIPSFDEVHDEALKANEFIDGARQHARREAGRDGGRRGRHEARPPPRGRPAAAVHGATCARSSA